MKTSLIYLFAFIVGSLSGEVARFDNYKLVRLNPTTEFQINLLGQFENDPRFDIWNSIKGVNMDVDVLLSPDAFDHYEPIFKYFNIDFKIVDNNIQAKTEEQMNSVKFRPRQTSIVGKYAKYTEISNHINNVVAINPDIVSSYSAGKTYEKRDIKVMVLKTNTSTRGIWIDCGIHAREWVSPSTCIFFADKLITEYRNNDPVAVALLSRYEFHIMPVVNPDGYEYTFTTYRYWRKNRAPNVGSSCIGTDLNRNFAFKWMVSGSSSQPCADTFAGGSPGSELETQAVQNTIAASSGKWDQFYTIHSYGAYFMPPWGYTSIQPSDYAELEYFAKIATDAIKRVNGTQFKIGPPSTTVGYSASGGSYDWAKSVHGVKYAYALELRPQQNTDEDIYGFALPERLAPVCGLETYAGLKAIMKAIYDKLN